MNNMSFWLAAKCNGLQLKSIRSFFYGPVAAPPVVEAYRRLVAAYQHVLPRGRIKAPVSACQMAAPRKTAGFGGYCVGVASPGNQAGRLYNIVKASLDNPRNLPHHHEYYRTFYSTPIEYTSSSQFYALFYASIPIPAAAVPAGSVTTPHQTPRHDTLS